MEKINLLAQALLCGEGDIYNINKSYILFASVNGHYISYVKEFIGSAAFDQYIDYKNGEVAIKAPILEQIYQSWYRNDIKVFTSYVDPSILSLDSVMLYINLFGKRHIDGISISTSIEPTYLRVLRSILEKKLKVPIILTRNTIKITNIDSLTHYLCGIAKVQHLIPFMTLLTNQEIEKVKEKKLIEGEKRKYAKYHHINV